MQATIENTGIPISHVIDWNTIESDRWFIALDDADDERLCIIVDGYMFRIFMAGSKYQYVVIDPDDDFPDNYKFVRYLVEGERISLTVT